MMHRQNRNRNQKISKTGPHIEIPSGERGFSYKAEISDQKEWQKEYNSKTSIERLNEFSGIKKSIDEYKSQIIAV